jgi:hypothetical protein
MLHTSEHAVGTWAVQGVEVASVRLMEDIIKAAMTETIRVKYYLNRVYDAYRLSITRRVLVTIEESTSLVSSILLGF